MPKPSFSQGNILYIDTYGFTSKYLVIEASEKYSIIRSLSNGKEVKLPNAYIESSLLKVQ